MQQFDSVKLKQGMSYFDSHSDYIWFYGSCFPEAVFNSLIKSESTNLRLHNTFFLALVKS